MNVREAQQQLKNLLLGLYNQREASTISDWVLEKITGLKKIERILLKDRMLPPGDLILLKKYVEELLTYRPVQYVLGESWFCGFRFQVDERVLIPRPETEELVEWIVQSTAGKQPSINRDSTGEEYRLLDIGTGSGCIPVTLKKKLPDALVYACDISQDALSLARINAAENHSSVEFFQYDILRPLPQTPDLPLFQVIVSNPPYIPMKDRADMMPNVRSFEPALALFVEDDDPLVFYRAIATFAINHLAPGGNVFVELHEEYGEDTANVFRDVGFSNILLKKDLQGKNRMIRASQKPE